MILAYYTHIRLIVNTSLLLKFLLTNFSPP